MHKVSVFLLSPGMKVGRSIYNSKGQVLLGADVILTSKLIKKLINLNIPYVYIDAGFLADFVVDDVINQETRLAAVKQVKDVMVDTKSRGKLLCKITDFSNLINSFIQDMLSKKSLMLNLVDLRSYDDYTFFHSVNVCVLSLMTGLALGYGNNELFVLGTGALLHDLGKTKIPDEILNKRGTLTAEEFAIVKKHPLYGYELIHMAKDLQDELALIAFQHHESYDGSGYPTGIGGEEFLEMAQIVAIADKFDALTSNRIYRKAYPPHEAYEMCAAAGNYLFTDKIVKAFLSHVAPYPSGSIVELSDGRIAVVIDTPRACPLLPQVKILFDSERRKLPRPPELWLAETKGLTIVRVLAAEEIKALSVE